jgi:hypothetical protein
MSRDRRSRAPLETVQSFRPGTYLTDGTSLFSVVGELPQEPSLRLVEDCRTLEILMIHINDLATAGVREVRTQQNRRSPQPPAIGPETVTIPQP